MSSQPGQQRKYFVTFTVTNDDTPPTTISKTFTIVVPACDDREFASQSPRYRDAQPLTLLRAPEFCQTYLTPGTLNFLPTLKNLCFQAFPSAHSKTMAEATDTNLQASKHGILRRRQRKIDFKELLAAVQHGKKEIARPVRPNAPPCLKYTFAGVELITDEHSKKEVTSWPLPRNGVEIEKAHITESMRQEHKQSVERLGDMSTWTSHTVVIVDQSGSMRITDTETGIQRSDLAWLTLAISAVGEPLKNGTRKSTDVFSLVSMREGGEILIKQQPFDWLLFNKIIDCLRSETPLGHGNYYPALDLANSLLLSNFYGGCALMLTFLSDGRPSDKLQKGPGCVLEKHSYNVKMRIEVLARQCGNRLTVGAIPIGRSDERFQTLRAMVEGARDYGSRASFHPPTLSPNTVSKSLSSLATSLTATMVAMTDVHGQHQRQYRRFEKEKMSSVGTSTCSPVLFTVIQQRVVNHWRKSIFRTRWVPGSGWTPFCEENIFHSPHAVGIAIKKRWFGEGAERLVKEFREVDASGKFVGPIMVAKDSKFVLDSHAPDASKEYHKRFCMTQLKAQKYAELFNRKADQLGLLPSVCPRIKFLECSVYMVEHPKEGRQAYLVERMLNIKKFPYRKWNDNAGNVDCGLEPPRKRLKTEHNQKNKQSTTPCANERNSVKRVSFAPGTIKTSPQENESSDDEPPADSISFDCDNEAASSKPYIGKRFATTEVAQAFSCFTYWMSQRRLLVCDLQGILNKDAPNGHELELTDPVIHHKSHKYGRTDRGLDGIHRFFETHVCGTLCRMMKSRFTAHFSGAPRHQNSFRQKRKRLQERFPCNDCTPACGDSKQRRHVVGNEFA